MKVANKGARTMIDDLYDGTVFRLCGTDVLFLKCNRTGMGVEIETGMAREFEGHECAIIVPGAFVEGYTGD